METDDPHAEPAPPRANSWWVLLLWTAPLAILLGLGGWWYAGQPKSLDDQVAEKKKQQAEEQKNKPKPDFQAERPAPLPNEPKTPLLVSKPGHWAMVTQKMRANYIDFEGEVTHEIVDSQNNPFPLDRTGFTLPSSRPVVLAKGSVKSPDTLLYTPPAEQPVRLSSVLRDRRSGAVVDESQLSLSRMLTHQYHFVVLAKEPDRYGFVESLYSVKAPYSARFEFAKTTPELAKLNYRVMRPTIDDAKLGIALADNALCWTSTAYLLWDEVDPTVLRPEQRDALIDWLCWGGQLIISGPDSLDLLKESFLAPYLPATSDGARELTAADLAPLNETFLVGIKRTPLKPTVKWSGVKLTSHAEATAPNGLGELLAERTIGRGRIVVTAFQLNERDLINWKSGFDNFFNSALLRRPPRRFAPDNFQADELIVLWQNPQQTLFDSQPNTAVRYFARDELSEPKDRLPRLAADEGGGDFQSFGNFGVPGATDGSGGDFMTVHAPPMPGGAAGWTDFSASANSARMALREAAGVNIPGAGFVLGCLAAYLFVLAPLNWAFFHALGKVEYAWAAAPFIALAGAMVVVKQAQLDIGFVRAQTEVAVLETQPAAPRGHLTRYMALYTSLSTTYDFEFESPSVVAAPFAHDEQGSLVPGHIVQPVRIERQEKTRLLGLPVSSATTELVHSEEMAPLGALAGQSLLVASKASTGIVQLENRSTSNISDIALVRRLDKPGAPQLEGCWIGELRAGQSLPYSLRPVSALGKNILFAAERAAAKPKDDELNLEPIIAVALDPARLAPGELRAVARIRQVLPGVTITPAASQIRGGTLVVAHLAYGELPPLTQDSNAPSDVGK